MSEVDFITQVHQSTKRDYVKRVVEHDKAACAEAALGWGEAYWDGDRSTGYGGYRYDGRWRPIAEKIVAISSLLRVSFSNNSRTSWSRMSRFSKRIS